MKRDAELKRAANLIKQLGAVSGNENLLSPEQLVYLREWRARRSAPTDMTDDELVDLYQTSLDANYVDRDRLRPDIARVLNANVPIILEADTDEQAALKWQNYASQS